MGQVKNKFLKYLNKLKPRGMQTTLMLSFSVISVLIMLILGVVLYIRFSNVSRGEIVETTRKLMEQTGENLEDYLVSMRQISDAVYYNVVKESDFSTQESTIQKGMNLLYEANRDNLRSIAIYNNYGSLMAAEPVASQKEDPNVTKQSWYQSAMGEMENMHFSTPHIQNLFDDGTMGYYWVISLSRAVELTEKGDSRTGVLLVDMDYSSISRMMDQINHLISEVYEGKIKLQNSEMKALQAQINPHFLYNSLSIINWKALEAGEDEISKVTLALSTYYRTSLNRGETMTTVENEISNIRAYLKIQLVMHDDSFAVKEEIDPEISGYEIPKLILQPLVENAIDHGLDMSESEEKCLYVGVTQDGDSLVFTVRDNGIGMEQQKADEILTYQSSGYGVRNVCERIQVLYGEAGSMKVTSGPGKGTEVKIKIPKKAGKKA